MKLTPPQACVISDTHRFRVVNIGRRGGKTTLAIEEMKAFAFHKPSRICYVAPTYQQARDIAWEQLKSELNPIVISVNESRLEIRVQTMQKGESLVILRGWESIESLRGQAFDFIVIDEIAMMREFWAQWQEIIRPTLTDRKGIALFISTPKGFNHFYDLYNMEGRDSDYKSFHFTTYDNPHIPKEEVDKAKIELTEDRFAQEYLADFRKTEGLIYKEFNRETHLFDDTLEFSPYKTIAGVDFGFTHPCAVITIIQDLQRRYFITDEWYHSGKTEEEVGDYVKSQAFALVYPDPENPSAIETLRRKKVNVRDVTKGKGSVISGIQTVRELLKANRLFIHKRCVNLINELETYVYQDKTEGSNRDELPIKEHDDACFIAGTMVDGNPIEEIGYQTGVKDVYAYQIAGETITATPHHPVMTQRGFADIDTLRYDDVIWKKKKLFMRVSGGTDIQAVIAGLTKVTFAVIRRIKEAKGRDYIVSSGKKRTGLSLMDSTYITLMAIPSIIHWIILSLKSAVNTLATIGISKSENGLKRISSVLFNLLPHGQKLISVEKNGVNLDLKMPILCSTEYQSKDDATCATKNTRLKEMDKTGSATITVVKKHYVGRVPVYNLITKSGMYLANGLLVSNCDAMRYALMMHEQSKIGDAASVFYSPSAAPTGNSRMLPAQQNPIHTTYASQYIPKQL